MQRNPLDRRLMDVAIDTAIIGLAALLFLSSVAWANPQSAAKAVDASGKLSGSAVVISDDLAITIEHVVSMARPAALEINGRRYPVTVVHDPERNQTDEAALLRISGGSGLPAARIASERPRVGDRVYSIGYQMGRRTTLSGRVTAVSDSFRGNVTRGEWTAYAVEVSFATDGGQSGAALFNERGEVVGLCSRCPGTQGNRRPPAVFCGLPSIQAALASMQPGQARQQAVAAVKPRLIMFTADWCGPCQVAKRDLAAVDTSAYDIVYVKVNYNGSTDNPTLTRAYFDAMRKAGTPVTRLSLPTFWIEGTASATQYTGVPALFRWCDKLLKAIAFPIIGEGEPNPVPVPEEVPYQDPFIGELQALKSDIDRFKSDNSIEKAKGLFAGKSDFETALADLKGLHADLKTQIEGGTLLESAVGEIRDTVDLSLTNATTAKQDVLQAKADAAKALRDLKAIRDDPSLSQVPALIADGKRLKEDIPKLRESASEAKGAVGGLVEGAKHPATLIGPLAGLILGIIRRKHRLPNGEETEV